MNYMWTVAKMETSEDFHWKNQRKFLLRTKKNTELVSNEEGKEIRDREWKGRG